MAPFVHCPFFVLLEKKRRYYKIDIHKVAGCNSPFLDNCILIIYSDFLKIIKVLIESQYTVK